MSAVSCGDAQVLDGSWSLGKGVASRSNAPYEGTGTGCGSDTANLNASPPQYGIAWQCVELAQRMYNTNVWYSGRFGISYASQIFTVANQNGWTTMAQGSISLSNVMPGDMVITNNGVYGHVMLVDSVDIQTNQVFVVDQNGSSNGRKTINYSGGSLSYGMMSFSGIVHSPNNNLTNNKTIMFLHKLADNGANMYTYSQTSNFTTPGFTRDFLASSSWNWNSMKIASNDVDYDNISDLIMLHKLADGGANLYNFYGNNFTNTSPVNTFPGSNGWLWDSIKLLTDDFDGDNHGDVMFLHKLADNGAHMYIFNQANGFASPGYIRDFPASSGWDWNKMKLATGDVNHDGVSDLIMLHKLGDGGANLYVFYGGSGQFANTSPVRSFPGSAGWSWESMKLLTGDFDGDNHADVMFLHKLTDNGANLYILTYGNSFGEQYPVRSFSASSGWNWNNMKLASVDVNNDNKTDLIMLHKLADGGANLYSFYSTNFPDTNPVNTFPGSSGWLWDSMLVPDNVR